MYHWTWFYMIPGVAEGTAIPGVSEAGAHSLHIVPTSWLICGIVCLFALVANRGIAAARSKGGTQQYVPDRGFTIRNLAELATEGIVDLAEGVFGSKKVAIAYLPLIGTLFLYILISNLSGLIPGFLPPTADISTNFALALTVFLVFNIQGLRVNGIGYIKHLMGPILALAPLIFVLETIGLLFRPISLSLRLFGNLNGDHMVFGVFSDLVPLVVPSVFLGLGVFVSFIQAFVFTLLSVVYVALAIAHDDH